jgi:hypothetical protein
MIWGLVHHGACRRIIWGFKGLGFEASWRLSSYRGARKKAHLSQPVCRYLVQESVKVVHPHGLRGLLPWLLGESCTHCHPFSVCAPNVAFEEQVFKLRNNFDLSSGVFRRRRYSAPHFIDELLTSDLLAILFDQHPSEFLFRFEHLAAVLLRFPPLPKIAAVSSPPKDLVMSRDTCHVRHGQQGGAFNQERIAEVFPAWERCRVRS